MGRIHIKKGLWLDYRRPIACLRAWLAAYLYAQQLAGAPVRHRRGAGPRIRSPETTASFPPPCDTVSTSPTDSIDRLLAEIEQQSTRSAPDGQAWFPREDTVTADLIDVGLLFVEVFGQHRGENFFRCTLVQPHVYRRVLLGPARKTTRGGDDGDLLPVD
jgi:hypothetical protein